MRATVNITLMSIIARGPPFIVHFASCFPEEDGVWQIDARVSYRDGVPYFGNHLLGEAHTSLLMGIVREGMRGYAAGAALMMVHLDSGQSITEIEFDELLVGPSTVH
jgi:hypothetical protein